MRAAAVPTGVARDASNDASVASRALLTVDRVSLEYQSANAIVRATHGVSFEVLPADRFVLLGPSGCGKSTLLKAVAGFLQPRDGQILLDGAEVRKPGPDRIVVFQEFDQLPPWKTVVQNVMFPLLAEGRLSRHAARARALHYLDKVGLASFADAYPHTLSGGMKQRVAIARALAMQPKILLMDEPFGALDALTKANLQDTLMDIQQKLGNTVMIITHDVDEAVLLSDKIVMMTNGPSATIGEICEVKLPRPRKRLELASNPEYIRARTAVLSFLYERQRHPKTAA